MAERIITIKYFRHVVILTILAGFSCVIFPSKVFAYLDPGSGSYIIQVVIGAFLAGMFAFKLLWNKIKLFFKKLFSKEKNA